MHPEVNPLKQYFRRPSVYFKLPSGSTGYRSDIVTPTATGELPVYPMTAIDEMTVKTPDALYNGTAVVNVIKSCIPNIVDPWKITTVDLDAILIAIKTATNGNQIEIHTTCPSCNEEAKYDINLGMLLREITCPDYTTPLAIHELQFKFKPLTFFETNKISIAQFEIQKKFQMLEQNNNMEEKTKLTNEMVHSISTLTMKTIAASIETVQSPSGTTSNTEHIYEFLRNCDRQTYEKIRDTSIDLRTKSEIKPLAVKCIHCQHEYQQPFTLNMSDFFE